MMTFLPNCIMGLRSRQPARSPQIGPAYRDQRKILIKPIM